jgi:two-component system, cell cycle sensor histidine kinase and response regulator CckA
MAAAKMKVLCVDDDLSGLVIRAMVLEKYGYEVITATDGAEALRLFHTIDFDAVLMDYYMPMVDGAYVARAMRRLKPHIPIVMISAAISLPTEALNDTDGFVPKGTPPAEMTNLLDKIIRHAA